MVSDGSYMASRHIGACSGAFVLKCTRTKQKASCAWAEVQKVSDNYRGELLGAIGFLSVIHAILSHPSSKPFLVAAEKLKRIKAWTDCNGVITHGNDTKRNLKQGQAHADLIYVIRNIVDDLPVGVEFKYVQGHLDDHIPYRLLTPIQRLNCDMDRLAKRALKRAIRDNSFMVSKFLLERTRIFVGGAKVIRSPTVAISISHGREMAYEYYTDPTRSDGRKVEPGDFDLVDWDALERAMLEWAQMYRVFYTKVITGCCSVKHFENIISQGRESAACPCCGHSNETTLHVLLCDHPTRRKLYDECISTLEEWLSSTDTDENLSSLILTYLRGRGEKSMSRCLEDLDIHSNSLSCLAAEQDRLGFRGFIEGRLSRQFERRQRRHYLRIDSRRSSTKWAANLVDQIF